jgi:hypothetical protein
MSQSIESVLASRERYLAGLTRTNERVDAFLRPKLLKEIQATQTAQPLTTEQLFEILQTQVPSGIGLHDVARNLFEMLTLDLVRASAPNLLRTRNIKKNTTWRLASRTLL